jgi:hypothetical protein
MPTELPLPQPHQAGTLNPSIPSLPSNAVHSLDRAVDGLSTRAGSVRALSKSREAVNGFVTVRSQELHIDPLRIDSL